MQKRMHPSESFLWILRVISGSQSRVSSVGILVKSDWISSSGTMLLSHGAPCYSNIDLSIYPCYSDIYLSFSKLP
jgi:hypothetical protein